MKVLTMIFAFLLVGGMVIAQEKPEQPVVKDKVSTTDGAVKVKTTTKKVPSKSIETIEEAKGTAKTPTDVQTVEASCGTCQFGMKGSKCFMAVKIDGTNYPVEGVDIHDHDAHGENGLCNAIREAEVTGELKDGKFQASSFKLLPVDSEQN